MSLDEFDKMKVVGKGSYGEVWLVRHRKDRKQVRIIEFSFPCFPFVSVTMLYL